MRILHVMASCSKGSGVAQVVMRYYRQMHTEVTFDFLVYWDVEDSFKEEIEQYGGHVYVEGKPGITQMPAFARRFGEILTEHEEAYTAVHLHDLCLNLALFPVAKKHNITRRIAHSHTTKFSEVWLNALRNRVLFYPVRFLATDFMACSYSAGEVVFGKKICNGSRFNIIKNAIDPSKNLYKQEEREKILKELGIESGLVVGHVGRFSPQKNHFFLLDVFFEVQKIVEDAKLLLVGDGPRFYEIKQKSEELGIGHKVIQTGVRSDVGALLSAMDVFVLPSIFEGLGNVLIEAQCNGLPCIASSVVPQEAAVLPSYQTLALDQSAKDWAQAIVDCANGREAQPQEYLEQTGYDIVSAANKLLQIYREMES